jgi:hypothetical protein
MGRNPGKGSGFTDLGPEKSPNPTQSEMWRAVSWPIPRTGSGTFEFMFPYRLKAEMKDFQGIHLMIISCLPDFAFLAGGYCINIASFLSFQKLIHPSDLAMR